MEMKTKIENQSPELQQICHQMAYGDDSFHTYKRYCILQGMDLTDQEIEERRQETFDE